ncbi:MAG: DNA topoisomerase IV subunit A [Rhodothermales bacterium]|nr:DNA topoisomerase IV subunit A [Rhodothermales bacterium]
MPVVDVIPLHETARDRYLNYALSVITSRALPDIRDGLKPVHRRILYAMYANLRLYPDARFRKSATVVGEVMGKYHPHGDSAIYEAMVRMAQPFSLRYPLVDGHGNFGSLDGDSPAAMRYTEAKLQPLAIEVLEEIRKQTVDFRPNYDGTLSEPVVLPARLPNLLVNGSSGIAVGMATNIPPHNLTEVIDALVYMIGSPNAKVDTIVAKFIQAPDFPTGGCILNTKEELVAIYENGEGTIDLRGEYLVEGKKQIIVYSIPYGLTKGDLIEKIADHVANDRVPQIVDVRDESTDDVRIVLELKRGADPEAAMAYLFKHTPLQTRFHVNMTCLVPTQNRELCTPQKVDLVTALRAFLDFRMEVVTRRLQYELDQLEKRIHILRGFEIIFDALDEAIRLIRASTDKPDAAKRLMQRFALDEVQTEAILETKLYKLSSLEIDAIRTELEEKERQADEIRALLADEEARWKIIKQELRQLKDTYGDARRTTVAGPDEGLTYSEEDYIVAENVHVIVTRDGWVKRQKSYADLASIRVREGDSVGWAIHGSTRATVAFLTNFGKVFTTRIDQLANTTGYGEPIQKLFDFSDRETIVGVIVCDERLLPKPVVQPDLEPGLFETNGEAEGVVDGPFIVAVSRTGLSVRIPLDGYADASTRSGRLFMRLAAGDTVLGAEIAAGHENVCLASQQGQALIFPVHQIPIVRSAAKGVIAIRLNKGDEVFGYILSDSARKGLTVETSRGRTEIVRTTKFAVTNRGLKGSAIITRGHLTRVIVEPVEIRMNGTE